MLFKIKNRTIGCNILSGIIIYNCLILFFELLKSWYKKTIIYNNIFGAHPVRQKLIAREQRSHKLS